MNKADLLGRIDYVLAKGQATIDSAGPPETKPSYPGYKHGYTWIDEGIAAGFRAAGLMLLKSLYPQGGPVLTDFDRHTNDRRTLENYWKAQAVISAVREEVDRGWFYETRALIAADVFSDFMEMAKYLLNENYDTSAAVLVGCTLEGHLRTLASRHNVDIHFPSGNRVGDPRSADSLNQDLYVKTAYSKQDNTFPLLADAGSATIKRYGIFNTTVAESNVRSYGIPFPGTFLLNRQGVVTARFFDQA